MNEVVLELGLSSTVVRRHFMNLLDPDALSLVEMMLQRSGKGAVASLRTTGDTTWLHAPKVLARVSRLMHEGACIGTAVRLACAADGMGDLVLVARNSVEENGVCLPSLSAFGSPLKFLAAQADIGVAVFRGPHGPGFQLQASPLQVGARLGMLAYPEEADKGFAAAASPAGGAAAVAATADEEPMMVARVVVSRVSTVGQLAIASTATGVPNSSGGPLLRDSDTVAGMYTGIVWHLEGVGGPSSPSSSPSSSCGASGDALQPPSAIERDPSKLWTPPASAAAADAVDTDRAAELSRLSVGHKNSEMIITTTSALWNLLQEASVATLDWLQAAAARSAARRSERVQP